MVEFFTTLRYTIRDYKITLGVILVISFVAGLIAVIYNKPTYETDFEISPYFEMAQDIQTELQFIRDAVNNDDENYLSQKLGITRLQDNLIKASYSKRAKLADYSFKHVNLILTLQLSDTVASTLKEFDDALINYFTNYVNDTTKSYRGMEVYKEKLKAFNKGDFKGVEKGYQFGFFKNDFLRQDLIIPDSTINQLIYAQVLGEYKSAFKINFHQKLTQSLKAIPSKFNSYQLFGMILFFPVFFTVIFLRSYKYE